MCIRARYNGCLLADSVGLGKTFTALAVIKYYENRNKSVLVPVSYTHLDVYKRQFQHFDEDIINRIGISSLSDEIVL